MTTETGMSQDNEGLKHFFEECLIDEELNFENICRSIIFTPFSLVLFILTSNSS